MSIRYTVHETGSVDVTLENELGNEDDNKAGLSPPAYPVAGIPIVTNTYSHDQKSYRVWPLYSLASSSPNHQYTQPSLNASYDSRGNSIKLVENHQLFNVFLIGRYPDYLKAYVQLKIESKEDLSKFISDKRKIANNAYSKLAKESNVPATITFNGIKTVEDTLDLVENFDLDLIRFRFTARNNDGHIIRGQGKPCGPDLVPLETLYSFIGSHKLEGIQSIDVRATPSVIEQISGSGKVASVDFSALCAILNANIDVGDFNEVVLYVEDASWYLNHAQLE
ncbi:MAG: hypothetical protein R6V83_03725 [Candidatus Thorarchaeota archaeon]